MTKSIRSVAQLVRSVVVEADRRRRYEVDRGKVHRTVTAVALRVAAHQRGACFEASYQRQNE
eukprot:5615529-Pleurochrysis_carterae.AAC.2